MLLPRRNRLAVCLTLAALMLTACAGLHTAGEEKMAIQHNHLGDPRQPYPLATPPEVGDVIHLPTGISVSEEQMLRAATDARIAYVGETHDNPAAHRLQLSVLKAMADRYPGKVSLGMEMFTPSQQQVLDRWVTGDLTEKQFLKQSRWYETWRADFDLYRDILVFARERSIPVLGINAEKGLVKAVGTKPPEELTDEQRAQLPEMDLSDPYQRAVTEAIYGGHDEGNSHLEGFLRVQTLWDETMAQNVAAHLQAPGNEEQRMVVLAGGNHVRYGYGIPRRVFRRLPASYLLIGSKEIVIPEDKKERQMDVQLPTLPILPYQYVMFTEYEDLGKKQAQIGVQFEATEGGLKVLKVVPESAAKEVGLQEDDILTRFDGEELADSFDLIYAIKQRQPGDRVQLTLLREGEEMQMEATLKEKKAGGHHAKKEKAEEEADHSENKQK